ncbi:MAG: PKD domain-containing protein, partial [Actinomycetota bacterium]|nr:PKD domain-containing protein [Actinomycetota bacterium]
ECQNLNDNARHRNHLLGKILRVKTDGTFPADNPCAGQSGVRRCGDPAGVPAGGGPCGEIFASGLRNPFRFAFKPGTNTFYINDVGTSIWEEINLGAKGADYGFNLREGHCAVNSRTDCGDPGPGLTNPIHDYDHQVTGCTSVTGAAFVPTGVWPAPWSGSYLYADYGCGKIFRLAPKSGGGFTSEVLAQGLGVGSAVTMTFGPVGYRSLYYTNYRNGGEIRRIARGNPPTASFIASPTSGTRPLTVKFDASASTDPEDDPLVYRWNFGDGTPILETAVPTLTHTFPSDGSFTVTLRVSDGTRESGPSSKLIEVGRPPSPQIQSPSATAVFAVGQVVNVTGGATDPDDGSLPPSALSWEVVRHHDTHTHPFLGPVTGTGVSFEYPGPEDLRAATNSFLEVRLTARDASGLRRTATQKLMPKKVNLTFQTNRSTPRLKVEDETFSGPKTYVSWAGALLRVNAPSPQIVSDRTYVFQDWSDGKPANHAIVVPATDRTYTASYARSSGGEPPPPGPAVHAIVRTRTGGGHWMPASTGKVYTAGDAAFLGDASSLAPASPVAGMAATSDGRGYWLATAKGKVYSFGTARFLGDASGIPLNRPIVAMAATPSGTGYWLVASDGGVFSFGDAPFRGSTGGIRLNQPIVGMAASVTGNGYWLVASDGGIFAFNAPFVGSAGSSKLSAPVVGMAVTPSGTGYWIAATDGLVLNYGDARFYP